MRLFSRLLRSTLVHNVLSVYGGQIALYLAPLITVPYLTRVLGVSSWGMYSLALSLSTQLALIVEYGFGIAGNRAVASTRGKPVEAGKTLGAVIIAKLVLIVLAGSVALAQYILLPAFHQETEMFWFAVAAGITQGLSFAWYLYGIERIALAAGIDLGAKAIAVSATLILVKSPQDAWLAFMAQSCASALAAAAGCAYALRCAPVAWPGVGRVVMLLRQGFSAMLIRPGFGVFTGLNTVLLGMFAGSEIVGQYAGAERIARVATVLPAPLCQALFPRFTYLHANDPEKLPVLRALGGTFTVILGGLASLAAYLFAPSITRLVLGAGYDASATLLRLLSPLPLLAAVNQVLLYQHLLPEGGFDYAAMSFAGTTGVVLTTVETLNWAGDARAISLAAGIGEAAAMLLLCLRVLRERPCLAVVTEGP